jgi:hypothetical protein
MLARPVMESLLARTRERSSDYLSVIRLARAAGGRSQMGAVVVNLLLGLLPVAMVFWSGILSGRSRRQDRRPLAWCS